ncbi:MAG: potassium channel family protein [Paramuribaculum sp.]|nr:potassium channel family protein [Paramuribaculum sp.]
MTISDRLKHFFHVVSNIRPIVWIALYVAVIPLFALIYQAIPAGQFRIPDGGTTDFGSWLYYSIVTITTLGFGDYTPTQGIAQSVTAVEVMCGLIFLGLFLNAVGSMKSEIDVTSEIERQKRIREENDRQRLLKNVPALMFSLNTFLAYCYAVTTPRSRRDEKDVSYNPDFTFADMCDLFEPSGLPEDNTTLPAAQRLLQAAKRTSETLDSLQSRVDLRQWDDLLENAFSFVAAYQMFSDIGYFSVPQPQLQQRIKDYNGAVESAPESLHNVAELYRFIKQNAATAREIETLLARISTPTA